MSSEEGKINKIKLMNYKTVLYLKKNKELVYFFPNRLSVFFSR